MNTQMSDEDLFDGELDRLNGKPVGSPDGIEDHWVLARVYTAQPVDEVLARCREVLGCVLRNRPVDWPDNRISPWPSLETWETLLPRWFVNLCSAETTNPKLEATATRIAGLPPECRDMVSHHTAPPLSAWLSCFESFRSWVWWDASVISVSEFCVRYIAFDSVHTNWSLSWLLVASGAWRLEFCDYPDPSIQTGSTQ